MQVRDSLTTEHEQQLIAANSPAVLVKPSKDAAKVCCSCAQQVAHAATSHAHGLAHG